MVPTTSSSDRAKRSPVRTCVGCRKATDRRGVLRLVRVGDGRVLVDHPPRLGGRGAWLHAVPSCVERALRRGGLARAFGAPAVAQAGELLASMRSRLEDRVTGMISSGRGGRHVAVGTEAVRRALTARDACLVLFADDARGDREALGAAARRIGVPVAVVLTKQALGRALGREEVGVVGVTDPGLAAALGTEISFLSTLAFGSRTSNSIEATG